MILATETGVYRVDSLAVEIERLAQLASVVLNEHTNDNDLCAVCGSAFPCGSAVLSEPNVGYGSALPCGSAVLSEHNVALL